MNSLKPLDDIAASEGTPREYHSHSAATLARTVDWSAASVSRWIPILETTRVSNVSTIVITSVCSSGLHDSLSIRLEPHSIQRTIFSAFDELRVCDVGEGSAEETYSLWFGLSNSTPYNISDSTFGEDFLKKFGTTLSQIDRLRELPEGWDSYQSPRIQPRARRLSALLLSRLFVRDSKLPVPIVGPSANGGVVLQWHLAKYEVSVEVSGDTCEYYVAQAGEEEIVFEARVSTERLEDVASVIGPFLR